MAARKTSILFMVTKLRINIGNTKSVLPLKFFTIFVSGLNELLIMQFVITAYDGAGMLDKRMEVRPRHLEGMAKIGEHVLCAGGLLDETGKMKGSVLVMEFQNRAELDAYLAQEPYVLEHVWERIEVERMNVVLLDGEFVKRV